MCRAHLVASVRETAENLNIKLYFIPLGKADELQPLDLLISGALKARTRGYWYTNYDNNPEKRHIKPSAA